MINIIHYQTYVHTRSFNKGNIYSMSHNTPLRGTGPKSGLCTNFQDVTAIKQLKIFIPISDWMKKFQ